MRVYRQCDALSRRGLDAIKLACWLDKLGITGFQYMIIIVMIIITRQFIRHGNNAVGVSTTFVHALAIVLSRL